MNKPTPGPWRPKENHGRPIWGYPLEHPYFGDIDQADPANARLILAAVNACFAVNPSNPMAVAEALPELVETARAIHFKVAMIPVDWKNPEAKDLSAKAVAAIDNLRAALAKLEAK